MPNGSSPRVWGIRQTHGTVYVQGRFIPTGVGNTCSNRRSRIPTPVHPHGCGEYARAFIEIIAKYDSSPRVWGIPRPGQGCALNGRFIPTGVGNTSTHSSAFLLLSVHPHGCGEYNFFWYSVSDIFGSSPRVWGIRTKFKIKLNETRFIPTGVGNTLNQNRIRPGPSVHPHGCGEYGDKSAAAYSFSGSSPRVWGIPPPRFSGRSAFRFIPTGVGNT